MGEFVDQIENVCLRTFPAARPSRTIPSFRPETCEDVEDDVDDAPLAFDAGKIFIFRVVQQQPTMAENFEFLQSLTGRKKKIHFEHSKLCKRNSSITLFCCCKFPFQM